jgi:hypothetical protein
MAGREGPAKQKCTSHPPDYLSLLWMTFSRSSLLCHAHDMLSHISAYPRLLFHLLLFLLFADLHDATWLERQL